MSGIELFGHCGLLKNFIKKNGIYLPLRDSGIDIFEIENDTTYSIQDKTSMFQKNS